MTANSILSQIEAARKDLLDFSLRNPLINYRTLRARGVEAVEADPVSVFEHLVSDGKKLSFLPYVYEDEDDEQESPAPARRASNLPLQTSVTPSELQRRLLNTYRTSNSIIQEQGVNTLFIALGTVIWRESDTSFTDRRAPLVFVPVKLERAGVSSDFNVSYTEEDLGSNISFAEKARTDFRLDIPLLDEDEDPENADLKSYFRDVERSVSGMRGWSVDKTSVVLGFFTFNKFLMYRDLDAENWPPGSGPQQSEIVRALFGEGFSEPEPGIGENDYLDDYLKPQDAHHVVDADSSQSLAIVDANRGRNLIIQGPPGTGKSQTITNIIAEAVGQRKKVLFVSEKMAALEVVKRRLDSLHIGDACLELHSHKSTKRAVLDELRRTSELGKPDIEGIEDDFVTLERVRSRLNEYAKAVNDPVGNTGITPFDAYGELKQIPNTDSLPRPQIAGVDSWSRADFDEKLQAVSDLQISLQPIGVLKDHPFHGSELRVVLPNEIASLRQRIHDTERSLESLTNAASALANYLGLDIPKSVSTIPKLIIMAKRAVESPAYVVNFGVPEWKTRRRDIEHLRDAISRWSSLHAQYNPILTAEAWNADIAADRNELAATGPAFLNFLSHAPSGVHTLRLDAPEWRMRRLDIQRLRDSGAVSKALHARFDSVLTDDAWNADVAADRNELADTGPRFLQSLSRAPEGVHTLRLDAAEWRERRPDIQRLRDSIDRWKDLHTRYDTVLKADAWNADVVAERNNLAYAGQSFFKFLYPKYRRAKKRLSLLCCTELPSELERQLAIADAIIEEQQLRQTITQLSPLASSIFYNWQPSRLNWDTVVNLLNWSLALPDDLYLRYSRAKNRLSQLCRNELPAELERQLELADSIIEEQQLRNIIVELSPVANSIFYDWRPPRSDWDEIIHLLDWSLTLPDDLYPRYSRAKKRLSQLCRAELPAELERQLEIADAIIEERGLSQTIENLSQLAENIFPHWDSEHLDWNEIVHTISWSIKLFDDIQDGKVTPEIVRFLDSRPDMNYTRELMQNSEETLKAYSDSVPTLSISLQMDFTKRFNHPDGLTSKSFEEQRAIMTEWLAQVNQIRDIARVNFAMDAVVEQGLHDVIRLAQEWHGASERLTECFRLAVFESILSVAFCTRLALERFNGSSHQSRIEQFIQMDDLVLYHNRARVAHSHWEGLPKGYGAGEIAILMFLFAKKTRLPTIRQLMLKAGNAIQAIKPVFMMSPLSIATYLTPGRIRFDLVIFDEASQVKPVDALGAMMRADKAVVVGDDRQLPPTSFFDAVIGADEDKDEDNYTADIESILGLMRAAGCPSRMLKWHYRSRHESLIAVSNSEFYENGLVIFPSPDSDKQEVGLQYHHLPDTVYDRGGSRTNRGEAKAVAEAVMDHARNTPHLTLGVAAFSTAQMNAILDQIDILRRKDDSCESFFADHPEEPFFVKNLENVQGDERDVIFISVGYGRDANGNIAMNFGPLNREGGERRLNVIITRARMRCHAFTNISSDDINLGSTQSNGVRAFKTFLAYAETGILPSSMPSPSGREVESPFQRAVASRLREHGYEVHEEVASGGKFIDIGIVDPKRPGRYLIGIECDGATYHSSRSARDRDKIREQVLIGLGWKLHRIWSTDWYLDEERELKRAIEAIEQAKTLQPAANQEPKPEGNNRAIQRTEVGDEPADITSVPYREARINMSGLTGLLANIPPRSLVRPIMQLIQGEGPIHADEIIRKIAYAGGVNATRNIKNNLNNAIHITAKNRGIVKKGEFLWAANIERPLPIRDRSDCPHSRNIRLIYSEEIAEAVKLVVKRSFGIDRGDAIKEAGRLLGFKRVTSKTSARIDSIITDLVRNNALKSNDEHLTLSD